MEPESMPLEPLGLSGLNELAAALCKAQAAMKPALKDSTNPHFQSRYADLAAIWEACRAPLTANGLAVIQMPERDNKIGPVDAPADVTVTTILLHTSGQMISSTISVRPSKDDAQGLGSAITYLRRYALAAMVGIAPDDDDGEAAVGRPAPRPPKPTKPVPVPPSVPRPVRVVPDDERMATLLDLGRRVDHVSGKGTAKKLMGALGIESSANLSDPDYAQLVSTLQLHLADVEPA